MAQQINQADELKLSCSICLDLLKDPVTIPCGHNYCMSCIKAHWDGEEQNIIYSCPQCRESFNPRPVLVKNTLLTELVEDRKKALLQAAAAVYCPRHDEVMKMFCRTDQQCICYLCSVDEHKGHDTVSAAAERTEKQKELGESRQNVQQRIQHRDNDVKVLQQEVEAINRSADKAVEHSEKTFTELIHLIQKRSSDVTQQIRLQQKASVSQTKDLQKKLDQEIAELKRKDSELDLLSRTEDHTQFLHSYTSLTKLTASTDAPRPKVSNLPNFEDVMAAVTAGRDKLQAVFHDNWMKPSLKRKHKNVSLPQAETKTRAEFLQYSRQITIDPNTANCSLVVSDGNRKIKRGYTALTYSNHPDKFNNNDQVLSKDGLTGSGYWEVEMSGVASVAVAYKSIPRSGTISCGFGCNKKSWVLHCGGSSYTFRHDNNEIPVSGPRSSRIGVYLDHSAGVLSFYSVSDTKTMTLLHRVQTKFTEPLYPGLAPDVYNSSLHFLRMGLFFDSTAEFCELK